MEIWEYGTSYVVLEYHFLMYLLFNKKGGIQKMKTNKG